MHQIHTQRRIRYEFTGVNVPFDDLPPDSKLTEATYNPSVDLWSPNLHQSGALDFLPKRHPRISATFDEYFQTRDAWEIDLLYHTKMSVDPYSVCHALAHGFCAVAERRFCTV